MSAYKPDWMKAAALKLVLELQFAVFSLCGKFPHKGSHGCKDATKVPAAIEPMWKQHPRSNIGIATGEPSGVCVVDLDMRPDKNIDGLASLVKKYGDQVIPDPDNQLVAMTPHDGLHLYFRTNGLKIKTCQGILPGVDIRGDGGYVVAPPSSLKVGDKWVKYQFCNKDAAIPPAPEWLLGLLNTDSEFTLAWKSQKQHSAVGVSDDVGLQGFPQGQRDEGLYRYACRLRAFDTDETKALELITQAARACQPPFDDNAARQKVEYVYDKYPAGSFTPKGITKSKAALTAAIQKSLAKAGKQEGVQ